MAKALNFRRRADLKRDEAGLVDGICHRIHCEPRESCAFQKADPDRGSTSPDRLRDVWKLRALQGLYITCPFPGRFLGTILHSV